MDHTKSKTGFGKLSKLVHGWETGMSVIQLGATSPPYSQGWSSFNCSFTSFRAASQAGKLTQPWREEQCSLVLHFNPSELTKRYWIPDCSQDESSQHIPHMHFSVETEVQWCRHSVPPCLCDVSHLVPYGISLSLYAFGCLKLSPTTRFSTLNGQSHESQEPSFWHTFNGSWSSTGLREVVQTFLLCKNHVSDMFDIYDIWHWTQLALLLTWPSCPASSAWLTKRWSVMRHCKRLATRWVPRCVLKPGPQVLRGKVNAGLLKHWAD